MSRKLSRADFVLTSHGVDGCTLQYDVELPEEKTKQAIEEGYKAYRRGVRVPGFRPGKAPMELIRRRYASEVIEAVREELLKTAAMAALQDMLQDEKTAKRKLVTGYVPNPDSVVLTESAPFRCAVTLELEPEFDLPDYENIRLPQEKPDEVTDEEVEEALEEWRERLGRYEDSDEPADMEDMVQVDAEGRLIGDAEIDEEEKEKLAGFLSLHDLWVPMIPEATLPGAPPQLVGARVGDERKVMIDFPEDFRVPDLAGKAVEYTMKVKAVRKHVKADLTDELVKERLDVENLEELRQRQRTLLGMGKRINWLRKSAQAVEDALLANADFPVPPSLLEAETRTQMRQIVREQLESGVPQEQIHARAQELSAEAERRAYRTLRLQYIAKRIAEKENITVPQERLDAEVARFAQSRGVPLRSFQKQMEENGGYDRLRDAMLISEVVNFIVGKLSGIADEEPEEDQGGENDDDGGSNDKPQEETTAAAESANASGATAHTEEEHDDGTPAGPPPDDETGAGSEEKPE